MRFTRCLADVVVWTFLWLVGLTAWAWLVFGVNGTFGAVVVVATPFLLLAWGRSRHQRRKEADTS